MAFENLVVEQGDAVAVVTITRPGVLNALNAATVSELRVVVDTLTVDDTTRAVIITGAGEKAFIAGADIGELANLEPRGARDLAQRGQQLCDAIERMGKPVIAAINGYALGGGCEVAMACSIRLAAEGAKIGQPEINLGLIPGYGGTQRLSRLVGSGHALEIMLTGDPITAEDACRIGLVNRVVPANLLMEAARTLATVFASKAPVAVRYILDAVRDGCQMSLVDGCAYEAALFGLAAATDDWHEGTKAFLDKRRPSFSGS